MEKHKIDEKALNIMMEEYKALREEVRLLVNAQIRDFQIFLAFLAATFAFSVRQTGGSASSNTMEYVEIAISFIPYLFFAFSFFYLIKFAQHMLNAEYLRNIEERINLHFKSRVLNWESSIAPKLLFKFGSGYVLSILLFSVLLLMGYLFASYLGYEYYIPRNPFLKEYRIVFGVLYILCPIVFLVFLLVIVFQRKRYPKKIDKLMSRPVSLDESAGKKS